MSATRPEEGNAVSAPTGDSPSQEANTEDADYARKSIRGDSISSNPFCRKAIHTQGVPLPLTVSSIARGPIARYHIQPAVHSYTIYGVDAIWHNQYRGPNSDFLGFRKSYDCDINKMIMMVARHVEQGLYDIISISATPNFLTVICGCQKMLDEVLGVAWGSPDDDEQGASVDGDAIVHG